MISIVQRPERFTPAGNPVIFQITTNNPNIINFRAVLMDHETNAVVNQMDFYPTPRLQNGTYMNLSSMLGNVVSWELNNDSFTLITPIFKALRSYRVKITERVLNTSTGMVENGFVYDNTSDVNYIFNSELGRVGFHNYLQLKYVINSSSAASFLTSKPNYTKVNDLSAEHLYFMHDGSVPFLMLRIKLFNASGQQIGAVTKPVEDLDDYRMFRINISPKALKDSNNVDFTNVAYYTVSIQDNLGQLKTVERVYRYEEVECWREHVNVLWVNQLGGIDSYQFHTPVDTLNLTKFQIKKNTHGVNADGIYSDINDGIFNPSDVIISSKVSTTTKVTSKELSDQEGFWLAELYKSKQVFIELPDLSLVPVLVNGNSFAIPRLKYTRGNLNIITLDLTLTDGVIPVGAQAYSNNKSSIEFIDRQLNTVTNNVNGYGLTQEESQNRNYSGEYGPDYS